MHILIIDGDKRSRELGARFLSEANHEVELADDASSGQGVLSKRVPEVILLDMYSAGGRLHEFISWIGSLEGAHRPYIILTLNKPGFPSELSAALARGAHDYVRKPWCRDELIFRANTLDRIRQLQASSSHDKVMEWSTDTDITSLSCWKSLEQAFAHDLAEVLCASLISRPIQEGLLHAHYAAEIPMTLTQNQALVQIGVGLDTASAAHIAQTLLGMEDPSTEVVQDLLREFANTAGGAFKRSAEQDQIDITTGLPSDVEPKLFGSLTSVERRHFVLSTDDASVQIFIEVELRSKGLHKIKVSEIEEGMVLSKDLLNSTGMLLVRSGTRLTSSNVARLCKLIPNHMLVEVAA